VGDTVLYSKYGGTEVTVDGEDILVLSSRDVLAKVKEVVARNCISTRRPVEAWRPASTSWLTQSGSLSGPKGATS